MSEKTEHMVAATTLPTGQNSILGRFRRETQGSMSYLAITGALVMMVFGGIGIDMIHAELKRTKMQNTLDRAVLAAADMENEMDPNATVNDYFRAMGMSDALVSIDVENALNARRVTANGSLDISANFMELLGVTTLGIDGLARAEEGANNIEVSLVLDISGSMANNSRLSNMQDAADTFLDTLLTEENEDRISVSLVPYSEHVNAGPELTNHLTVDWMHGYSHCIEMPEAEFNSAALSDTITYEQVQHYQWNYFGSNTLTDTVCPRYSYERISAFSQNKAALKNQLNSFQPRAGTAIFMGMKWATALLDPSTRGVASDMIGNGSVDTAFSGRPVDYDDPDTIKTIVLMTDGQHDRSMRIQDWAYNSSSEVAHWANNNLWYYLVRNVYSHSYSNFYYQKFDAGMGDGWLDSICTAAKNQGIIIWSVGFEVTDHGASVMQQCASSPSHFFRVEGVEIEDAFYSIARTINQLRLTQ